MEKSTSWGVLLAEPVAAEPAAVEPVAAGVVAVLEVSGEVASTSEALRADAALGTNGLET